MEHNADSLLREMDEFPACDTVAFGTNDPEDDGLPFESLSDFSTEPLEFNEMAERMLAKVENLFDLSAVYNRHSEKYLKTCAMLERGIKYLGSVCLTKTALALEKKICPGPEQLSTTKLYRMASFNNRKLDEALTENLKKNNALYPELLDMEFRYFNLLRRLRATEAKINSYHFKWICHEEDEKPLAEGKAFRTGSRLKTGPGCNDDAPVFRQAPAFPLFRDEIRENGNQKNDRENLSSASEETLKKGLIDPSSPARSSEALFSEEVPEFVKILDDVVKRSLGNEDGALSFTYEEIEKLAADPQFHRYEPALANEILHTWKQMDSG